MVAEQPKITEAPIPVTKVRVAVAAHRPARRNALSILRLWIVLPVLFVVALINISINVTPVTSGPIGLIEAVPAASMTPPVSMTPPPGPMPSPPASMALSLVMETFVPASTASSMDTAPTASVEEPTSKEVAALPVWGGGSLARVLYPTRMLRVGEQILETTHCYWNFLEVAVLRRVAIFFARGCSTSSSSTSSHCYTMLALSHWFSPGGSIY